MSDSKTNKAMKNGLLNFKEFQNLQMDAIKGIRSSLHATEKSVDKFESSLELLSNTISNMVNDSSTASKSNKRLASSLQNLWKTSEEGAKETKKSTGILSSAMRALGREFNKLMNIVADTANRYSQLSNDLISVSGASGKDVRSTRSEIVHDIVGQLNKETGYYFNAEREYEKMINVASSAGIGNLEAIEELSRPMMLAAESMKINQTELAKTFNKFYTRYNFSSRQMESMVDEIRGNTAGNNATAEATQRNLELVNGWISYYAKGDTDKINSSVASLSKGTSWLESMGVDTSRYAEYMKKIMTGEAYTDTSMQILFNAAGVNNNTVRSMATSGNLAELMQTLFEGEGNLFGSTMNDSELKQQIANVFGHNLDDLMDAYDAQNFNKNYISLSDFKESTKGAQTAVEAIDDKFVDASTKIQNILSGISEYVAKIQEYLPLSVKEILSILGSILTAVAMSRMSGGRSSGGSGGGILSKLGGAAKGVGVSGGLHIAGGALLASDGIRGAVDKDESTFERVASGVEAAAGLGAIAAVAAGSGPAGWAALAVGGAAFLVKNIYDTYNSIGGMAKSLNAQYKSLRADTIKEMKSQKNLFAKLKDDLKENADLEQIRQSMIQSGIMTQSDIEKARLADKDGLEKLTDAYLTATKKFGDGSDSDIYSAVMNAIRKEDANALSSLQLDLNKLFQDWNDHGKLYEGSEEMKVFESWMLSFQASLDERIKNGEELDDYTKRLKEKIDKGFKDGKLNHSEANAIMDLGWKNQYFKESDLGEYADVVSWMNIAAYATDDEKLRIKIDDFNKKHGATVHDPNDVNEMATNLQLANDAIDAESAAELLDRIKAAGWTSSEVPQIGQVAQKWGLKGYRVGSNYIDSDQVAVLHEGESVVPKKYNPAANVTELEMLREYYKDSTRQEASESSAAIEELKSVVSDIRSFLELWKDDNIRRETAKDRRSTLNSNANFVASYMNTVY